MADETADLFNDPETAPLADELRRETELKKRLSDFSDKVAAFASWFGEHHFGHQQLDAKLEDRDESAGKRELKFVAEPDGSKELGVYVVDPAKSRSGFGRRISVYVGIQPDGSILASLSFNKNDEELSRSVTLKIDPDDETSFVSNTGSGISGESMVKSLRQTELFMEQVKSGDPTIKIKTQQKADPKFGLPPIPDDHPEAPLN